MSAHIFWDFYSKCLWPQNNAHVRSHKSRRGPSHEFGRCPHRYCHAAPSLVEVESIRSSVWNEFGRDCTLCFSLPLDGLLPPRCCFLFLPMRHFGQCLVWQRCTPAERVVRFRAVYYPRDLRQSHSKTHRGDTSPHQKLTLWWAMSPQAMISFN